MTGLRPMLSPQKTRIDTFARVDLGLNGWMPSFSGTRRAQSESWNHVTCLSKRRMLQQKQKRKPVMTMRCRAVRDWFLSLGASSRWMGSLFRRLGNAVRHRDELIAPRRLESMPVCRTQHFAHRNEEEDTTERWSNSPERTQSVSITSQGRLYQDTLVTAPMWFIRTSQRGRGVFLQLYE